MLRVKKNYSSLPKSTINIKQIINYLLLPFFPSNCCVEIAINPTRQLQLIKIFGTNNPKGIELTAELTIAALRTTMAEMKEKGEKAISIDALEQYFIAMEAEKSKSPFRNLTDDQRHQLTLTQLGIDNEKWKVQVEGHLATGMELFKAVIEAGQSAVKSLIIMNGGAAIALLAFLGNLLSRGPDFGESVIVAKINYAMVVFLFGVGFAGTTSCLRYIAQALYMDRQNLKKGNPARNFAVFFALCSLSSFLYGGYAVYAAFLH